MPRAAGRFRVLLQVAFCLVFVAQKATCVYTGKNDNSNTKIDKVLAKPREVVVTLKPTSKATGGMSTRALASSISATKGMTVKKGVGYTTFLLKINDNTPVSKKIRELNQLKSVKIAEPNYIYRAAISTLEAAVASGVAKPVAATTQGGKSGGGNGKGISKNSVTPADPKWNRQWNLKTVHADDAWVKWKGRVSEKVCIIDTGIDGNHPDLQGQVDPIMYNAITGKEVQPPFDDNEHGTHMAGIIGARSNNNIGIAGMNWNVRMVGCKFMNSEGEGTLAHAIACINWCRSKDIFISSNSYGGVGANSEQLREAITRAGGLFVTVSGNEATSKETFPGAFNLPNLITVAASQKDDGLADFSNFGPWVHLVAPGVEIVSTVPGGGYQAYKGTSMAGPHVAGAALLAKTYSGQSWSQVQAMLLSSVDKIPGLQDSVSTSGRLNVLKLLDSVASSPAPTPPTNGACRLQSNSTTWARWPNDWYPVQEQGAYETCCDICNRLPRCKSFAAFQMQDSMFGQSSAGALSSKGGGKVRMRRMEGGRLVAASNSSGITAKCDNCNAVCDIFNDVPHRLCRPGETVFWCKEAEMLPYGTGTKAPMRSPSVPSPSLPPSPEPPTQPASLEITLSWAGNNDLDLAVTNPNDCKLFYENLNECGGTFSGDCKCEDEGCSDKKEAVRFDSSNDIYGNYVVEVTHYGTNCRELPAEYTLTVVNRGVETKYEQKFEEADSAATFTVEFPNPNSNPGETNKLGKLTNKVGKLDIKQGVTVTGLKLPVKGKGKNKGLKGAKVGLVKTGKK